MAGERLVAGDKLRLAGERSNLVTGDAKRGERAPRG